MNCENTRNLNRKWIRNCENTGNLNREWIRKIKQTTKHNHKPSKVNNRNNSIWKISQFGATLQQTDCNHALSLPLASCQNCNHSKEAWRRKASQASFEKRTLKDFEGDLRRRAFEGRLRGEKKYRFQGSKKTRFRDMGGTAWSWTKKMLFHSPRSAARFTSLFYPGPCR